MRQLKSSYKAQSGRLGGLLRPGFWVWALIGFVLLTLWPGSTLAFDTSASEMVSSRVAMVRELNVQHALVSPDAEEEAPPSGPLPDTGDSIEQADMYGVVVAVKNIDSAPGGALQKPVQGQETIQRVKVRLASNGPVPDFKNRIITVDNVLGENPAYNIPLKPGARVLLNMEKNPATGKWIFYIANRDRTPAIMILGALFIMAVLVIGGSEVAKHALLVTLILTGCYKALFPAVLAGTTGPNWILLMCFMYTILASFIYQAPGTRSFSREQSVVILGTLGGLVMLVVILWIMHEITPLDGYSSEGLASLWYQSPKMDYWTFFLSGALIGYQGLLFHLCWSLSQNRKQEDEWLDFSQRFQIVMMRGRRLLGPMLSSVGLLFLGLFMPILLQLQGTPTAQFVNLESTASMLAYAFAGGLTLILTVPLTALISAWMLSPGHIEAPGETQPD
jgi:uncharacterized membrane protein